MNATNFVLLFLILCVTMFVLLADKESFYIEPNTVEGGADEDGLQALELGPKTFYN